MRNIIFFILAALFEISGFYLFWLYSRSGHSVLLLIPAIVCQLALTYTISKIDKALTRQAYAMYGSIFIICTLLWMHKSENFSPDIWDFILVGVSLTGIMVLLLLRIK